jgi:hypothetical protein
MTTYFSKLELCEMEIFTLSKALDSYITICEQDVESGKSQNTPEIERLKNIKARLYSGMHLNSISVYDDI